MDAVNPPISQTYLVGILSGVYAAASHIHASTSEVTGLDAALAGKQSTLVSGTSIKTVNGNSLLGSGDIVVGGSFATLTGVATDNASLASALNAKLNLSGGTLTGSLNFPGTGILGSPGTNIARLFSSVDVWIQANSGTITLISAGATTVTVNAGVTKFENATSFATLATVRIDGRGTQDAALLQLDNAGSVVGDSLTVKNGATTLARITKTGQGQFVGVDITGGFFRPPPMTFGALPSASANSGVHYRLTDRGQKEVYSDGTNWLWVHDNSIAS
jgi:hypothetical protein